MKRYSLDDPCGYAEEIENQEGDWVKAEDALNAVKAERERIISVLLSGKVEIWIPEAGDLWPVHIGDLRKFLDPLNP